MPLAAYLEMADENEEEPWLGLPLAAVQDYMDDRDADDFAFGAGLRCEVAVDCTLVSSAAALTAALSDLWGVDPAQLSNEWTQAVVRATVHAPDVDPAELGAKIDASAGTDGAKRLGIRAVTNIQEVRCLAKAYHRPPPGAGSGSADSNAGSVEDEQSSKLEVRALMLGPGAAGKTSALYWMHVGAAITTIPTVGFNVETVNHDGISFTVWDMGGQEKLRPLWRHYYQNTQVIIYVVDAADVACVEDSKGILQGLLAEEELVGATLLVLANKQDLPTAMSAEQVAEALDLRPGATCLKGRLWTVLGASTLSGEGFKDALDWLAGPDHLASYK